MKTVPEKSIPTIAILYSSNVFSKVKKKKIIVFKCLKKFFTHCVSRFPSECLFSLRRKSEKLAKLSDQ